jgi:hypothetical protein
MKLTLQQHETTVTIEHKNDDMDIDELIETIIKPLLIAGGWGADLVEETFNK